jgi:hypothetical protein
VPAFQGFFFVVVAAIPGTNETNKAGGKHH